MWRFLVIGLAIVVITLVGFSLIEPADGSDVSASALLVLPESDISGFDRAIDPWDWQFPEDHGSHPTFQTEWWYYTGNLITEEGRRFGFQFTIFRRAISPRSQDSESEWRSEQIYLAHFTVSDIDGNQFYHDQRLSRGGAGLAGATADPVYTVWLEDWRIKAQTDDAQSVSIKAASDEYAIDLILEQTKPPALQGEQGLSPKSDEPGNASYYYSLSRLLTSGTITINGTSYDVVGTTWMDHEFSTSALGDNAQGWHWFGLIFDDGREAMIGQIRLNDGDREAAFGGLLINEDGTTRLLEANDFTITATASWISPHSGAEYPAGWTVTIDDTVPLEFQITPLMSDQELHGGGITYWEGAVQVTGDVSGYGYAELTGYTDSMQGRF